MSRLLDKYGSLKNNNGAKENSYTKSRHEQEKGFKEMKKESNRKIKIGFTGTQNGMSKEQKISVNNYLVNLITEKRKIISEVHHGDCVGADSHFHDICVSKKIPVFIHPPSNSGKRAYCKTSEKNYFKEKDYLVRNHDIVDATDFLIAAPKEWEEEFRSGTWATVRYAKKNKKKVVLIYPNGKVELITEH